jgi:hypothetical protein
MRRRSIVIIATITAIVGWSVFTTTDARRKPLFFFVRLLERTKTKQKEEEQEARNRSKVAITDERTNERASERSERTNETIDT